MPVAGLASPLRPVISERPGLAQRPDQVGFGLGLENRLAQAQLALGQRGQRILHLVKELDRQDGLAGLEIQFQQIARGLEFALPPGLVEQYPVQVFDGGGLEIEQLHRRLHRLGHRGKEDERQALLLRQRHDLQLSRGDGCQRPLAAAEQVVEVVRFPRATVYGVTGPAFRQAGRQPLGDGQPVEDTPGP